MPGLVFIISKRPKAGNISRLESMAGSMKREDFYTSGAYFNEEAGCYIGWACHRGSYGDCLPVKNGTGNRLLFFHGENHGGPAQGSHAPAASQEKNRKNAREILDLFEEAGEDFLMALNGWFQGILVDLVKRELLVFNDRFGMQRLYYCQDGESMLFASEAKALLRTVPGLRKLDWDGLAEWFTCGCALGNRTLFEGVSLLPPGSVWKFCADGSVQKRTYFDPSTWEKQPSLPSVEYSDRLRQTFSKVLPRYTNGDRSVGMSLTGGLDGRMIMACAQVGHGSLPCYSFNGPYRDCADARLARAVAALCQQPHRTIAVGDDFLDQFPRLAEEAVYVSDGAMDVTGAAELYVNRLAREIAPVRLTGNYGSEVLRRYVAFRPRPLPREMFAPEFFRRMASAAAAYTEASAGNRLSFIVFKQAPWHHYSRLAVEQSQITVRSPYLDNDLVALAFQAPPEAAGPEQALRLIAQGNPGLGQIPTDRGIIYPGGNMANRANRSIQEFLARAEYAYDYGMPNWLAKVDKCLAPLRLERLFLGRQKFCHFRSWYRRRLADYVKEVLLDPRSMTRPYLHGPALERMVMAHTRGVGNYTVEIHKLLSLELLHRSLLAPQEA